MERGTRRLPCGVNGRRLLSLCSHIKPPPLRGLASFWSWRQGRLKGTAITSAVNGIWQNSSFSRSEAPMPWGLQPCPRGAPPRDTGLALLVVPQRQTSLELWCYYSWDFEWLNVYMHNFAYLHLYVYIYTHWVYMYIQNNASVCNLVFKETNQHRLLFKRNLDSSTSKSWWKAERIAFSLKQRHFSSGQQHKGCAFMYITCFQRWKIMLKKTQKLCFINGLAWMHVWKVEYLYRTALSKGWIRHAEHVQRKCIFTEGASKPLTLCFSKAGE